MREGDGGKKETCDTTSLVFLLLFWEKEGCIDHENFLPSLLNTIVMEFECVRKSAEKECIICE